MAQTSRLDWHGDEARERFRVGAVKGLDVASQHLLGESRAEVPIEEATLERSGVATVDSGSLTAAVSYDTPYAVRQHEEMTYRHAPGRKAKYLEDPANRERETLRELIATQIRREMGT